MIDHDTAYFCIYTHRRGEATILILSCRVYVSTHHQQSFLNQLIKYVGRFLPRIKRLLWHLKNPACMNEWTMQGFEQRSLTWMTSGWHKWTMCVKCHVTARVTAGTEARDLWAVQSRRRRLKRLWWRTEWKQGAEEEESCTTHTHDPKVTRN